MSGHSKWATIHRQKEVKDSRRGALFTKLAQAITLSVRQGGGGDPGKNFRLRLAIEHARSANMPKDNIERAIERAVSGTGDDNLTEVMYEGFAPGGVAVLVQSVTDNKLRTAQKVREVLDKSGGSMGSSGSVSYLFSLQGELVVSPKENIVSEEQELEIMDQPVNDIFGIDGQFVVYCDREKTFEIKEALERLGYNVESAQLVMKPSLTVDVPDADTRASVESILERLEELDDVQKVWTNYN